MVVIINKSAADGIIVKNKDARSESVDSFSSTIDVNRDDPSKKADDDLCFSPWASPCRYGLANDGTRFDVVLPVDRPFDPEEQRQRRALSSVVVLDSPSRPEVGSLLDTHNGHLVDVGSHLLEGLRTTAPSRLAARVGDYNENLFYEMRDLDQGVGSIVRGDDGSSSGSIGSDEAILNSRECGFDSSLQTDIASFENSIRRSLECGNMKYRGSFMQTERTMYQPAHVDYDYPILQSYGERLFLAFFPLTKEGAFLQLWRDRSEEVGSESNRIEEGTVVFIPHGKMLIVPSDTIHGGGFKRGPDGNLRFHLYIELEGDAAKGAREEEIALLDHPMNKYTERHDRRRELCERFVDADGLESLLGTFFDA